MKLLYKQKLPFDERREGKGTKSEYHIRFWQMQNTHELNKREDGEKEEKIENENIKKANDKKNHSK